MKLLIVDDEANVREMMRMTLEAAGYDVEEAESGPAAIAAFGDGTGYSVVLLDQKMPGLDGLQTLTRLLDVDPEARIIMVTAFASIELAVDAMRLGATNFLRKPMTPDALRGAVAAALADRRRPAPGGARAMSPERRPIQTLTLNGFRIERTAPPSGTPAEEHVFLVTRFPAGPAQPVAVTIDPEAVARVARLTGRHLRPSGAFWRNQAERLVAAHLWSEGRLPASGRLAVTDVSRTDLDVAAAWASD